MTGTGTPKSHKSDCETIEIELLGLTEESTAIREADSRHAAAPHKWHNKGGITVSKSLEEIHAHGHTPHKHKGLRIRHHHHHEKPDPTSRSLGTSPQIVAMHSTHDEIFSTDSNEAFIGFLPSHPHLSDTSSNHRDIGMNGNENNDVEIIHSDIDNALLREEVVTGLPLLPTDSETSTPIQVILDANMISQRRLPFKVLYEEYGFCKACLMKLRYFISKNWGVLLFIFLASLALTFLGIFAFDPLTWKAWMAFAITVITLALLMKGSLPTNVSMLLGVTAMLAFFIIKPSQALVGFSNVGVATVAVLFTVSEGIQRTSVLKPILRILLGKPNSLWLAQIRLCIPVSFISAFLNNTPVVAMMIPVVLSWARRGGLSASRLLMPMNNAALLGGTCTLLGTSTNLVVVGLAASANLVDNNGDPVTFPIFGITLIGIPYLAAGLLYMFVFSRFLLKDRTQALDQIIRNPREYTVALKVEARSTIIGETIAEAGLRNLKGLFLVEMTRDNGDQLPAPGPETKIEVGDILLFAGVVETVTELYHIPGLVPANTQSDKIKLQKHRRRLVELVISPSSSLVGMSVKESRFRKRFSAAIIAVHRHGEHVREKVGDIIIRAGDVLLVETSDTFIQQFGRDSNFALVAEVAGSQPPREDKLHMFIAGLSVIAMIAVSSANLMDLLIAALLAMFIMIGTQCMTLRNAGESVSIPVIMTIALSFGLSQGLETTGAATQLANFIVDVFKGLGTLGLLFGIYIGTALLSAVITNNAAVALMFPIVADPKTGIIVQQGLNTYAALYVMMLAASASFATPIGYQTNLMVHGPGGYTFLDWVVFGLPLQGILCVIGVFVANWVHPS